MVEAALGGPYGRTTPGPFRRGGGLPGPVHGEVPGRVGSPTKPPVKRTRGAPLNMT